MRVPEDISVVGINDIGIGKIIFPALTSVRVPFEEMGWRAAELLRARIAEPERPVENVKLPETLTVRRSTARTRATSSRGEKGLVT